MTVPLDEVRRSLLCRKFNFSFNRTPIYSRFDCLFIYSDLPELVGYQV